MKIKDIAINGIYAIGAPNATYSKPQKARVVAVGVTGVAKTSGSYWRTTHHRNYVEIEVSEEVRRYYGGCQVWVMPDGEPYTGSGQAPEGSRKAIRVPSTNVLRLWEDQEVRNDALARSEALVRIEKEKASARLRRAQEGLEAFDITSFQTDRGDLRVHVVSVEKILSLLTKNS